MIIKYIPNVFDKKDRIELDVECSGKTVKQYFRKHFKKKALGDHACIVSGKRVEWDGPSMTCTNVPEANQYVRREYREGWSL